MNRNLRARNEGRVRNPQLVYVECGARLVMKKRSSILRRVVGVCNSVLMIGKLRCLSVGGGVPAKDGKSRGGGELRDLVAAVICQSGMNTVLSEKALIERKIKYKKR